MTHTIYLSMVADSLHHGHIKVLKEARKYGEVIVGLMTDASLIGRRDLPILNFDQRHQIVEGLTGVTRVVPQEKWSLRDNILALEPDYVIHGDDWVDNDPETRDETIETLNETGGQLIEVEYSSDAHDLNLFLREKNNISFMRSQKLRRLLAVKNHLVFMETHSPLSALIVESARIKTSTGAVKEFDGFWSSSLTDSTVKCKPDTEVLSLSERLNGVNDIFEVTSKPLIIDFDTGGLAEHFALAVRSMERYGISAVIIEDKKGLKKNSLFGNEVTQHQETIDVFCEKIKAGKQAQCSSDFMIISRIESLILGHGQKDAIKRALAYVAAGTDAIMIHSRQSSPDEILTFMKSFREHHQNVPLVVVPTSFNGIHESDLFNNGANIIIHANQLLRASYPAMMKVAQKILEDGRSKSVDDEIMTVKEILELIPGTK
jgi:phosphoenolpyruvate phosphomutase / 2-hydroxyethylphosphonate cytidylyltransferase